MQKYSDRIHLSATFLLCAEVLLSIVILAGCTSTPRKVTDIDRNTYSIVKAGSKIWTGENLDVTHFQNGDSIPEVKDPKEWALLKTAAWCYNDNKKENGKIYGKLYNWYAVSDPRGIAPKGWHVATDSEWNALSDELGGAAVAGGALKANRLWKESKGDGDNESGLAVLPGGARRDNDGWFMPPGEYSRLWSSTEASAKGAWSRSIGYFDTVLRRGEANKKIGFYLRCVKD
jgi:uncharacterized protein (TIGR02145 family)